MGLPVEFIPHGRDKQQAAVDRERPECLTIIPGTVDRCTRQRGHKGEHRIVRRHHSPENAELEALRFALHKSAGDLIGEALTVYVSSLPEAEQKRVAAARKARLC